MLPLQAPDAGRDHGIERHLRVGSSRTGSGLGFRVSGFRVLGFRFTGELHHWLIFVAKSFAQSCYIPSLGRVWGLGPFFPSDSAFGPGSRVNGT